MSFLLLGLAAGFVIGFWLGFPTHIERIRALEREYTIKKKLKDEFGVEYE